MHWKKKSAEREVLIQPSAFVVTCTGKKNAVWVQGLRRFLCELALKVLLDLFVVNPNVQQSHGDV